MKLGLVGRVATYAIGVWLMASAGLRGETLGAVLATHGMNSPLVSEANASTEITSYGTFKSQDLFVIAYYRDTGTAQLPDHLEVLSFESAEQNWKHKELGLARFREETQLPRPGGIVEIRASEKFLFVRGHKNPSAAVTLVLSRADLEFSDALYGWVVGIFADGLVVYEHSQVHFAPTHYTELSLYDPIRKEHRKLYPLQPYQRVRLEHIRKVQEAYRRLGEDWFRNHNHHMNPDLFNNGLSSLVATDDATHSLAFTVGFDRHDYRPDQSRADESPGSIDVLYVYPSVSISGPIRYREILLEDFRAQFGTSEIQEALRPAVLRTLLGP